jgi:hypothetical protein
MVTHRSGYWVWCSNPGGVTVRVGWAFIGIGVVSAAWGQHADVYVLGGMFTLLGIVLLFVKEEKK